MTVWILNIYYYWHQTQLQKKLDIRGVKNVSLLVIDRYWFFITDTDTDYLYGYVPDNRYSEPIFIYSYKVNT